MLTILDILEGSGFPPLIIAVATEENQGRVLGEVLAEAVKVAFPISILLVGKRIPFKSSTLYFTGKIQAL